MVTRRRARSCGWADATKGRYTCQPVLPVKSGVGDYTVMGNVTRILYSFATFIMLP